VSKLAPIDALNCAFVDRTVATELKGCHALGFPLWKDGSKGPRLAQVDGEIPTAEGVDPQAVVSTIPPMTLKITNQQIRERLVLAGDIDQPGSPWAGMSGSVIVTDDNLVVGVVRGHSLAEGMGSLAITPLEGLIGMPEETTRLFWESLNVADVAGLPRLPILIDPTARRLGRIRRLEKSGYLKREAVIQLQVQTVLMEFQADPMEFQADPMEFQGDDESRAS
jgi:hypothetical protein